MCKIMNSVVFAGFFAAFADLFVYTEETTDASIRIVPVSHQALRDPCNLYSVSYSRYPAQHKCESPEIFARMNGQSCAAVRLPCQTLASTESHLCKHPFWSGLTENQQQFITG